jgi:hypothetical protein
MKNIMYLKCLVGSHQSVIGIWLDELSKHPSSVLKGLQYRILPISLQIQPINTRKL